MSSTTNNTSEPEYKGASHHGYLTLKDFTERKDSVMGMVEFNLLSYAIDELRKVHNEPKDCSITKESVQRSFYVRIVNLGALNNVPELDDPTDKFWKMDGGSSYSLKAPPSNVHFHAIMSIPQTDLELFFDILHRSREFILSENVQFCIGMEVENDEQAGEWIRFLYTNKDILKKLRIWLKLSAEHSLLLDLFAKNGIDVAEIDLTIADRIPSLFGKVAAKTIAAADHIKLRFKTSNKKNSHSWGNLNLILGTIGKKVMVDEDFVSKDANIPSSKTLEIVLYDDSEANCHELHTILSSCPMPVKMVTFELNRVSFPHIIIAFLKMQHVGIVTVMSENMANGEKHLAEMVKILSDSNTSYRYSCLHENNGGYWISLTKKST